MKRTTLVFDSEVYPNWTLFLFRNVDTGVQEGFEHQLDLPRLREIVRTSRLITFNGGGYDIPILTLALKGANAARLKHASDRIIVGNLKPWNFEKEFNVRLNPPELDHIDLMEVAPLTGSLKAYAGRLHAYSLQDLPIAPSTHVNAEQIQILRTYCANDLESTAKLFTALKKPIELREQMSKTYGIDLRSKSDAQIAEAVIKTEMEKRLHHPVSRPLDLKGNKDRYVVPSWMGFRTIDILEDVRAAEFVVSDKGAVVLPKQLANRKITIGGKTYKMGIGGLHSMETRQIVERDVEYVIEDVDVVSYYPAIVLNQGLYPAHLGPTFLTVYRALVEQRLEAKRSGNASTAASLKITINGAFGKLGSQWSILYSPGLMIQVTLTGQLALLMLIEALAEIPGVEVVSANTDGVTSRCHLSAVDEMRAVVKAWEVRTGFETERAEYRGLYSRDVNNYIAITTDGAVKTKGVYGKGLPLHKNPVTEICAKAVIDYLLLGIPIRTTVELADDIRQFVSIRKVTGGAIWRGQEIGRVIRWYYSNEELESIHCKQNGYLVPKTDGAVPCMQLPDRLPDDLDREWYVREAESMLADLYPEVIA